MWINIVVFWNDLIKSSSFLFVPTILVIIILELYNILVEISFNTSKTKLDI